MHINIYIYISYHIMTCYMLLLNSSCSGLSSYWNEANSFLSSDSRQRYLSQQYPPPPLETLLGDAGTGTLMAHPTRVSKGWNAATQICNDKWQHLKGHEQEIPKCLNPTTIWTCLQWQANVWNPAELLRRMNSASGLGGWAGGVGAVGWGRPSLAAWLQKETRHLIVLKANA